jgi:hypothetical protein
MLDFYGKAIIIDCSNSRPKSLTGYFCWEQLHSLLESKPLSLMFRCTLRTLLLLAESNNISESALYLIGEG